MANVNFKDRKRSELVFETGDSSNVTLVCADGSLKFPSFRLLGMCSPVVRSSNSEEVVIILPDFLKSTVSTVLEVVGMKWKGEKAISTTERELLVSLGIKTGALSDLKIFGQKEQKDSKLSVKIEPGQPRRDNGRRSVKMKQNNVTKIVPQKEQDIIKTKLEKTHSEINLAIVTSKAKQIDYFMCDLCDDKVPKSDLKTHCDKEHKEIIGTPSDSEIQTYFRPCPPVETSSIPPALVSEPENLQSTSETDKYSIDPKDEILPSKLAEMYGGCGLSVSIVTRGEKSSIKAGTPNKKPGVQNSQGGLQTQHTPKVPSKAPLQPVPKVKSSSKIQGMNLSNTIARPAVPPQLTKRLPHVGLPVKKELEKTKSSEPMQEKSMQATKVEPVSDQDEANQGLQKMMSTSIVEGTKNMFVKCPQCDVKFGGNWSTVKFELRSHIGLTHYKNELLIEIETTFVENKCIQCEKMLKTKEEQLIHLLYNHTRWVELISAEADKTMNKRGFSEKAAASSLERRRSYLERSKKSVDGIKLVPTSKLLSPQAKREKDEEETKHDKDQSVVRKAENIKTERRLGENVEVKKVVGKCIHCEKYFSGNDSDDISIHFLTSHTATNDSYFLASNQCFVCDIEVLPEDQNLHMMKMHDYMKSEIQSFILQVMKNTSTSNIGIKNGQIKSEARSSVLSKVDDHGRERPSAPRKAPDSIADIQRKLLAIVGTQAVQDIDDDPDFEEVVDDEEDAVGDIIADDLGEENIGQETDRREIKGVQAELIKMKNVSIKMQNISDDEDEEDDRMEEFDEDTLEDVLNFKEEEVEGELEEVYKDISDDEYCGENGEDDEMEREISLMREGGNANNGSELEELV